MPVSTDRVVCIPVKLDIPVHLEMLQEHVCQLDNGVGMILIVQVTKPHKQHALVLLHFSSADRKRPTWYICYPFPAYLYVLTFIVCLFVFLLVLLLTQ